MTLQSVTNVDVSGGAGAITIPSSSAVGDIAILFNVATFGAFPWSGSTTTWSGTTIPSGWTLVDGILGTGYAASVVCYKTLTAGEPGSTAVLTWRTSGGSTISVSANKKILMVFRPSSTITSITVNNLTSTSDSTSSSITNSLNMLSATSTILGFGHFISPQNADLISSYSGLTMTAEITGIGSAHRVGYLITNSGGTLQSGSMTISSFPSQLKGIQSFYLQVN